VSAALQRLHDEAALRRTSKTYATGADRRDAAAWRREGDGWRFTNRRLVLDWEEARPVTPRGDQA
jgi:hypothetical protein